MNYQSSGKKIATLITVFTFWVSASLLGETKSVLLTPEYWEIERDVEFVEHEGRQAIQLKGSFSEPGIAKIKSLQFTDGIIEFDMWIEFNGAMFTGIDFRIPESRENFEFIYFRPRSNNQYDAFQYYPHYNHESTWQLYGQHQRQVNLPEKGWFHFKMEVKGSSLACYIHEQEQPFFYTTKMGSGSSSGEVQFVSSSETYISNLKITEWEPTPTKKFNPVAWGLSDSYLTSWTVSSTIALENDEKTVELDSFDPSKKQVVIKAEEQGLISFTRYIDKPADHCALLASTTLVSDKEQVKQLKIAYSDRMDLYLNGELVFRGDNTFRSASAKLRSRVHLGNDSVELKLRAGENKLEAIVYELFGGWALVARLENSEGIM